MKLESTRCVRRRRSVGLVLVAVIALVAAVPATASNGSASTGEVAGLGVASALSSLVYGPVKIVYATLGTVIGGIAWGLSGGDSDVLEAVLLPAVRGDYVVTPSHLRGERSLEFIGRRPGYARDPVVEQEVEEGF